jgi:phage shock protein A
MPFDDEKKIKRLKEKEAKLVSRGKKAVDEGRERKADRLLGRAARVENRIINLQERDVPLPSSNF